MPSKFRRIDIGKAIANYLQMEDQKNFPALLHTDELLPVICIGGSSFSPPEVHKISDLVNGNLVGTSGKLYSAFGATYGADSVANPNFFADTYQSREHWIRGIELDLTYDGAGAAADAGQIVYIEGWIVSIYDSNQACRVIGANWTIKSGYTFYPWVFPQVRFHDLGDATVDHVQMGQWDGYVPSGFVFQVGLRRSQMVTLGTFPANTTLNGHIWVSEAPEGVTTNGH